MATKKTTNELDVLKAERTALKQEVSELGRLYELRGRELTAERKRSAKVDVLEAELAVANDAQTELEKRLAAAEKANADLHDRLGRADDTLADVAALKRLVS